jgi:hypothetical protein
LITGRRFLLRLDRLLPLLDFGETLGYRRVLVTELPGLGLDIGKFVGASRSRKCARIAIAEMKVLFTLASTRMSALRACKVPKPRSLRRTPPYPL